MSDPAIPKPKRKRSHADTYAGRVARGKPMISLTIDKTAVDQMDALAAVWGMSRTQAIVRAVAMAHAIALGEFARKA